MASPNYDVLSIAHSKNIGDTVAAAATNGARWTSAQRDNHLNEAIRRLLRLCAEQAIAKMNAGRSAVGEIAFFDPYILEEAKSLTNNVLVLSSWTGTATWILSAYNSTDSVPIKRLSEAIRIWVLTGGNSFLTASATNQYWIRDAGNFRLVDGATNSTDSITLRFVKAHAALSAGGSADILLSSSYWDWVTDIGYVVAFEEAPNELNDAKAMQKKAAVLEQIKAL